MNNSFHVVVPPMIAEASPPPHRGADGKLVPPGGPMSEDARDCGPAKNHCLRGNAWFGTGFDAPNDVGQPATAVFPFEGHWYAYNGEQAGGTIYRTKPATADEIQHARIVWVLLADPAEGPIRSALPKSEHDALLTRRWSMLSVYSVDAKAGTFVSDGATYKVEAARLGVEAKSAD